MSKLTLATMCFNQLEDTLPFWEQTAANIANKDQVQLLVVDNGCTDNTVEYLKKEIFPQFPDHILVSNSENIGVVPGLNQCYEKSNGDVVAMLHNDVFIFEKDWDLRVLRVFEEDPKVGMVGLFGATGIGLDGGRVNNFSNMIDAEVHLATREYGQREVVIFDGMALICRREMLDQVGGFDKGYIHHFYDKDISLESFTHGWKNILLGLDFQHRGGLTAARQDYADWANKKMETDNGDQAIYNQSEHRLFEKWGDKLPIVLP